MFFSLKKTTALLLGWTQEQYDHTVLLYLLTLLRKRFQNSRALVTKALYSPFSIPLSGLVFLLLNCNKLTFCISNVVVSPKETATSMSRLLAVYSEIMR